MPPRRFSLDEAEALLPRLTAILGRMRELREVHERCRRKLAELGLKMRSNGRPLESEAGEAREEMERIVEEINGLVAQMEQMGCELKDPDTGLVDFRAEKDGREVYLCWKLGEERIAWWHELDTGFAGRRPLQGER